MYAAIDVGTNTIRLLLAEVCAGKIAPVRYYRKITRLGGGFSSDKGLAPHAMELTLSSLREIAAVLNAENILNPRAVGTAALRNACNGAEFIGKVHAETGLHIEIIEGAEEARLCARGVMSALDPSPQRCLIFDIGGGSTEFSLQESSKLLLNRSYPLGVVTLSEQFTSPERLRRKVDEALQLFHHELTDSLRDMVMAKDTVLVGTAGTVTTLAAIHLGMTEYDWRRINNLVLARPALESLLFRLERLSPGEREVIPGMEKGRGDLIVPGLLIVLGLMVALGKEALTVSDFGLLEGIILSLAETERCKGRKN